MNNVDINESINDKNERKKIIFIYLISIIIFFSYILIFIGRDKINSIIEIDASAIRSRMNIVLSIMCIISCMMFYKSNKKEEIFIMSLLYIILCVDIIKSGTTGFLSEVTHEYHAIITSFFRLCIAFIAINEKSKLRKLIMDNKRKSMVIVSIMGYLAINIEYYFITPYSDNIIMYFQMYNISLTIIYIIIAFKYFVKSINENEYIFGVIGASILLFSIKSILDFYCIVNPSIYLSIGGDSALRLACTLYILGIFLEMGDTTNKNKQLEEQRKLFIKIIDDNKHSNTIICDENYIIRYKNKKATKSLNNIKYIPNFESNIGCKLDIEKLFGDEIDLDIIDYHLILDGNYRKEIYIKQNDSILDFSIHIIEANNYRYKVIRIKDISEKYKLEKTLLKYEMIKQDELIKNEFFSNISHELKTPLNIIYSTNQLLDISVDRDDFKDVYLRYSSSFNINCKRMQRLIDNIVDITKLDVGFKTPKFENYNIVHVIEEMTLSVVNYAKYKNIEIIFDTDIEELYIKCDVDMIERILLNLISNAIKFSDEGSKIVVILFHNVSWVGIKVIDEGIGIDPEIQNKIFDRFVQGDKSIRREKEGSGIGLSLVKSFVELLDGKIFVKSDGKSGSEFTVLLPNEVFNSEENVCNLEYNLDMERVQVEFSDIYELYEHTYTT